LLSTNVPRKARLYEVIPRAINAFFIAFFDIVDALDKQRIALSGILNDPILAETPVRHLQPRLQRRPLRNILALWSAYGRIGSFKA
jgi:hypothetical protein